MYMFIIKYRNSGISLVVDIQSLGHDTLNLVDTTAF